MVLVCLWSLRRHVTEFFPAFLNTRRATSYRQGPTPPLTFPVQTVCCCLPEKHCAQRPEAWEHGAQQKVRSSSNLGVGTGPMLQLPHALQCPCGESDSEQPSAPRNPGGWGWDACFCLCHVGIWCLLGRKVLQAIDRELWVGFQRFPPVHSCLVSAQ